MPNMHNIKKCPLAAVTAALLLLLVTVGSKPMDTAYAQPQLSLTFICVPYDSPPNFIKWWIDFSVTGLPSGYYTAYVKGLNGALGGGGASGILAEGDIEGQIGGALRTDSPTQTFEFRFFTDANSDLVPDEGGIFLSEQFDFLEACKGGSVEFMVDSIESMDLNRKVASSLTNSLNAAINALDHGNTQDACNTLDDFIAKVTGFKQARKLTADEAATLIQQTNDAKQIIGC
jgi:hypothetical protein